MLGGDPRRLAGRPGGHWEATGKWSWGGGRGVSLDRLCCRAAAEADKELRA